MATKKTAARKPTQEEIEVSDKKEREIWKLQAEAGLEIAHKLTASLFYDDLLDSTDPGIALEVYDLLERDDEGEPLADQARLRGELEYARSIAAARFGRVSPEVVVEVHDRLFASFDDEMGGDEE